MPEEFLIKEYRDEDLEAFATHWKESVRGWPPGFEVGSDFSPGAVRDWIMRTAYIALWLGWLGDKIVSFVKYAKRYEDPDVTFVDLFNAHPDFHGRGYGRRVLTFTIDRAIRDGVKRVDLFTWAANTKAVPLYRKSGFFWRPRTSWVHMYNFLPAVLANPLVKEFLGDSWWYDALRQPLELKEDDDLFNGCSYHKYTFEKDSRRMEVLVDPSTSGVVGIETDDLTVRCDVRGLTHVAGLPQKISWTFASRRDKPVRIKVRCKPADGLQYSFEKEFELKGEKTFETEVIPSADLRPEKIDWYGKPLECSVEIDGIGFSIRPGVRVVRPFEITSSPYPVRLVPGEERSFVLLVRSRIGSPSEFVPEFRIAGDVEFVDRPSTDPIRIAAEDTVGIPLKLRAAECAGAGLIELSGALLVGSSETRIHPVKVNVGIAPLGQPVELPDDDPEFTAVSNGVITLQATRRGGTVEVFLFETGQEILYSMNMEVGEPISRDLAGKDHSVNVIESANSADVIFKVESGEFPGIGLERRFRIGSGYAVDISMTVRNGTGKPFNGLVRYRNWAGELHRLVLPLGDRIVTGSTEGWLDGNFPLPTDASRYPEPWTAWIQSAVSTAEDIVTGILFEGASRLEWFRWGSLYIENAVDGLAPGETTTLPTARFILKAGCWRDVQAAALKGKPSVLPTEPVECVHPENPLFIDHPACAIDFNVMRSAPIGGAVTIRLPDGTVVERSRDDWNMDNPIQLPLPSLEACGPGIIPVEYSVTRNWVERSGRLALITPMKDCSISITQEREGDYDFFRVDNGCIEYDVSPKFSGALVRLREKSSDVKNLLQTPFPKTGMWTWFNPWFGGVMLRPWFGVQFHQSEFSGDQVRIEWSGREWEGVRVAATLVRELQSMKLDVLYLTRPGCPVVLNLFRFTETCGCERIAPMECIAFPNPTGGNPKDAAGLTEESGRIVKVGPNTSGTSAGDGRWAAVYDPETGKTLGFMMNQGFVSIWDAAECGKGVWLVNHLKTVPHRTVEVAAMYAVADDPEHIALISEAFVHWGTTVPTEAGVGALRTFS